jgi:hypothetical protein
MIATFAVGWMVDPITTLKVVNEFMFSLYEDSQTTHPSIVKPSPQLQDPISGLLQTVPHPRVAFWLSPFRTDHRTPSQDP